MSCVMYWKAILRELILNLIAH
jgi:hypothetical protein